jgi:RNA polymerase sigma factor (sigma-70 family)
MKLTENEPLSAPLRPASDDHTETPMQLINRALEPSCSDWPKVWAGFLKRVHNWRIPPRWCSRDWREEIEAEIIASACHSISVFDARRGPTLASFVYHRILASALARYRNEWKHARRCRTFCSSRVHAADSDKLANEIAAVEEQQRLKRSLAGLPDHDRRLIERLYWEGWTEVDVAGRLGISQQAVSKRKQRVLREIRKALRATGNQSDARVGA